MRLLLTWLQFHPALGQAGRIQAGAHQATDAEDFDTGRRFEPDTDLDRAKFDAKLAASPPRSVDDLLAIACELVEESTGFHVATHKARPPEPEPAQPEDGAGPGPDAPTSI